MKPKGSLLCSQDLAWHVSVMCQIQFMSSQPIFKIHYNTVRKSISRTSKWALSFRFHKQNSVCISLPPQYALTQENGWAPPASLDILEKRYISCPCQESNHKFLVIQQVA